MPKVHPGYYPKKNKNYAHKKVNPNQNPQKQNPLKQKQKQNQNQKQVYVRRKSLFIKYVDPLQIEINDNVHGNNYNKRTHRFNFEDALERGDEERRRQFADLAPRRKIPQICIHWIRGLCQKNEYTCERHHTYDSSMLPVCQFFLKGECTNPDCIFRHPSGDLHKVFCVNYAYGFCPKGPKCTELHYKGKPTDFHQMRVFVERAIESHERAQKSRIQSYKPLVVQ